MPKGIYKHKPNQGFQKGNITWNKGKNHSKETKNKMSISHKGLFPTEETRAKLCLAQGRENNPRWKGGIQKHSQGYIQVNVKDRGIILAHRLVMEKHIGRNLNPEEVVHHLNGIRNDNRIENLHLFKNEKEHQHIGHFFKWKYVKT